MRLTADTELDAVSAHVAGQSRRAALRTSQARADRLQRNARIRTGRWDLEVRIDAAQSLPARLDGPRDSPTIVLSGRELPQPVTDFPPREWDLLVQTVLVMHEVGHLAHSSVEDLQSRLQETPTGWRPVLAQLWNAFEDGVVEAAIRDRWPNYGRWFDLVRANLVAGMGPGIGDPSGGRVYPMVHAMVLGIGDSFQPGTGTHERLLDPEDDSHHFATESDRRLYQDAVSGHLEDAVAAVATTSEAAARNQQVIEFYETVRGVIAEAEADGRAQVAALETGAWGFPDDARAPTLAGDADAVEPVEIEVESSSGRTDSGHRSDRLHEVTETVDPDEGTESDTLTEHSETDVSAEDVAEIEQTLSEAVAEQQRHDSTQEDSRQENLEDLQAAVEAAATELESDGVVLPEDVPEGDAATAAAAKADGERLAQVLRNRFQKRRKRSIERQTRRGRLDPAALHRHATGEKRVKHRHERPDEIDHHCLFVLDRSGSMRPHIRVAERAMGMLVYGLEAVDVNVEVLELLDKEVRLAKPPDQEADRATGRLFHGDATGGTPLTDTLHIARERLKQERGKRFIFVITDGRPSDPERYREALNRFSNPVVGVNLTTDEATGASEFHRQVTVAPEIEALRGALRQLVQEVLFG